MIKVVVMIVTTIHLQKMTSRAHKNNLKKKNAKKKKAKKMLKAWTAISKNKNKIQILLNL
jgi:hypothetical protein